MWDFSFFGEKMSKNDCDCRRFLCSEAMSCAVIRKRPFSTNRLISVNSLSSLWTKKQVVISSNNSLLSLLIFRKLYFQWLRSTPIRAFEISIKMKENYSMKSLPIFSFLILEIYWNVTIRTKWSFSAVSGRHHCCRAPKTRIYPVKRRFS